MPEGVSPPWFTTILCHYACLLCKPASVMGAGSCLSSSSEVSAEDRISEVCEEGGAERLQDAVRVLIQGLGEDLAREGLRDTPKVGACQSHRFKVTGTDSANCMR